MYMDRALADSWLAHRPKDRRGLPIPYINHWGPPGEERVTLRHDGWVGMRAAFAEESGDTVDYTRQHMGRQRESMARGLCQVCGRQVPWSRRNLVVADVTTETIVYEKREVAVVTEPWLCDRCAEIATSMCPALIRRRRDERLTVVPVRSKREVQLYTSTGWVEGEHEASTKASPVAMWVKAAILSYQFVRVEA